MTKYQLIRSADSLETALDIVRDEIIDTITDEVVRQNRFLKTDIQPCQFIGGQPYVVKGVKIYVDDFHADVPVLLLNGHDDIPLEEASTPVLTAILAII